MKSPGFRYMGGKYRIKEWLISNFPPTGRWYFEPFVGKGNVFFHAKIHLKYEKWAISDRDTSFFRAILDTNFDDLPHRISRESFEYYKKENNNLSKLMESRITFGGKGFQAGYNSGGKEFCPRYRKEDFIPILIYARELLDGVKILEKPWDNIDFLSDKINRNDFIYFDPPYLGTKASYPNIDHVKLIETINQLKCRWAISGYASDLYEDNLRFSNRLVKVRNSELKMGNTGKAEPVNEILWTSY